MIYTERTLERALKCPMMTPTGPSKKELCAYALASWALRMSFEHKLKGKPEQILSEIRGKVIDFWKGNAVDGDPGAVSRTAGYRIFSLLMDYEVLHVEEPYNLSLAGYTIHGKYAMLRKRKGEQLSYILVLHTYEPIVKQQTTNPPDIATLARYLHATSNAGYAEAQVLHYPVFSGRLWFNKTINQPLACKYLESMLKVASIYATYPVSGEHCSACLKPCMEVFHE